MSDDELRAIWDRIAMTDKTIDELRRIRELITTGPASESRTADAHTDRVALLADVNELRSRLAAAERVVEAARVLKGLVYESATILSLDEEVDELCGAVSAYDAERGR